MGEPLHPDRMTSIMSSHVTCMISFGSMFSSPTLDLLSNIDLLEVLLGKQDIERGVNQDL